MTAVQVGHSFLNIPRDVFDAGDRKGTIIDSGTTLAHLPEMIYEPLVSKVCAILEFWNISFSSLFHFWVKHLNGSYSYGLWHCNFILYIMIMKSLNI